VPDLLHGAAAQPVRIAESPGARRLEAFAWLVAAAALAHALYILFGWLNGPLLDQHSFRQTQTALSVYWISQGGPILAYDTPVLGSPWAVPFEAPVYHVVVALVAWLGVPLDAAGRLVSFAFLIAAAWPLRMLWRDLGLPRAGYPMACAMLLASPLYLFWGRTFMIESCAWFFALLWLAFFVRLLSSGRAVHALAAFLAGSLAVLAKATSFPAFALVGGLIGLGYGLLWLREGVFWQRVRLAAWAAVALFLPFVIGFVWVAFSDGIKNENVFGRLLTSAALGNWNYGNMAQRFGSRLWSDIVLGRIMPNIFGVIGGFALILLAAAALSRQAAVAVGLCLMGFLAPILVFTNLHMIHNYYQFANGAFLLVAASICLASLPRLRYGAVAAGVLLVVVVGSQALHFRRYEMRWLAQGASENGLHRIGLLARDLVPPGQSLLVLGEDWSSTVPYYSRRRSLALPYWSPQPLLLEVIRSPQTYLQGAPLGGVVDCILPGPRYGAAQPEFDAFLAGRRVLAEAGHCRLLSAERG